MVNKHIHVTDPSISSSEICVVLNGHSQNDVSLLVLEGLVDPEYSCARASCLCDSDRTFGETF